MVDGGRRGRHRRRNAWKYVVDREDWCYGLLGLGIIVASGLLYGIADGKRLQRIAREQYAQFAIISVVSAGLFAACYVATYSATSRLKKSST